jgi:hypothetical protein
MRPGRKAEGSALKSVVRMPITGNGMGMPSLSNPLRFSRLGPALAAAMLLFVAGTAEAAPRKKAKAAIPLVAPAPKPAATVSPNAPASEPVKAGETFAELNFNRTLVIEGKVEKPAVQFTLLKEPPPEKEILFETSFLQNILKIDRENTFKAGETYGRE